MLRGAGCGPRPAWAAERAVCAGVMPACGRQAQAGWVLGAGWCSGLPPRWGYGGEHASGARADAWRAQPPQEAEAPPALRAPPLPPPDPPKAERPTGGRPRLQRRWNRARTAKPPAVRRTDISLDAPTCRAQASPPVAGWPRPAEEAQPCLLWGGVGGLQRFAPGEAPEGPVAERLPCRRQAGRRPAQRGTTPGACYSSPGWVLPWQGGSSFLPAAGGSSTLGWVEWMQTEDRGCPPEAGLRPANGWATCALQSPVPGVLLVKQAPPLRSG